MSFTVKKYRVSISFCHKVTFYGKTKKQHLWILSQIMYMTIMYNRSII
jgi:hypothetical protein